MIFRKKKFKYYGDEYNDFDEPTNKKEEIKLMFWLLLIVIFPLLLLMLIRYVFKYSINLAT